MRITLPEKIYTIATNCADLAQLYAPPPTWYTNMAAAGWRLLGLALVALLVVAVAAAPSSSHEVSKLGVDDDRLIESYFKGQNRPLATHGVQVIHKHAAANIVFLLTKATYQEYVGVLLFISWLSRFAS